MSLAIPADLFSSTGCRDCGRVINHPHPMSSVGHSMYHQFHNVHVTIYYDPITKHFLHYIHGSEEKVFLSCRETLSKLVTDKAIGSTLKWAGVEEETS